ncbi:MAG: PIN domain-containing protein [Acetobacteraceae bacterium]|nr:PIN domain-containing protein [Acetobacteraceae bacterium]
MATAATRPLVEPDRVPLLYLDANVLLPEYLRAIFLDLADAGLVRVHWGEEVLAEVRRNLLQPRFGLAPEIVDRLFGDIAAAFPDALVRGGKPLEVRFKGKTDPKDAHVAAGALKLSEAVPGGQPVVLVTSNIRHLPETAFAGTAVRPARPGAALKALLDVQPDVPDVLDAMLARFKNPRVSRADLLDILDASNCRAFATALGKAWGMTPAG